MARRMIDGGMWSNENFAALPAMGRLLLIGIITLADDQGRCKANPAYLRSQIFPYEDIATSTINNWLDMLIDNGTLTVYVTEGKAYLQLINWWEYQPLDWARPSEYPAPQGWQDRIRYNAKGNVCLTHNWRTKSGNALDDTCDGRGVATQVGTIVATQAPTKASTQVNKTKLNKTKVNDGDGSNVDGWYNVVATYEREIGLFTETISAEMGAYYDEVGETFMVDAIKEAARANIRKWSYVAGILKQWRANGRQSLGKNDGATAWQQLDSNTPDYMKG